MIGAIFPFIQIYLSYCLIAKFLNFKTALSIVLVMSVFIYIVSAGRSWRSKLDHYLKLDGRLISTKSFPLFPGDVFYASKGRATVVMMVMLVGLFWFSDFHPNSGVRSVGISTVSEQKAAKTTVAHEASEWNGVVALQEDTERFLGWDMMSRSQVVSKENFKDDLNHYFFADDWIGLVPYEW